MPQRVCSVALRNYYFPLSFIFIFCRLYNFSKIPVTPAVCVSPVFCRLLLTSQPFLVCTARNVSLNKSINITLGLKNPFKFPKASKIFQMRVYTCFQLKTASENNDLESRYIVPVVVCLTLRCRRLYQQRCVKTIIILY